METAVITIPPTDLDAESLAIAFATGAVITVPLRTGGGLNAREHHMARSRRVKVERQAVAWSLLGKPKPDLPCTVLLTRVAPSAGLDTDNLQGSLKAVRDAIANWLGVDDKHAEQVRYEYAQERGPWAVTIEFNKETPP